jgi:hypothetical protein
MELAWEEVEENEEIKKGFTGYRDGLVTSTPGGWTMLPTTANLIPKISKMEVRPSDVWVVTYPKCGTTWTQELVWQIVNKVDLEGGKAELGVRFPFLKFDSLIDIHWWENFIHDVQWLCLVVRSKVVQPVLMAGL